MKKILLLIACVAITLGAYAQDQKFSWGAKAALNMSNYMTRDGGESNLKLGYQAGLVGEYRVSRLIAIAPELVFSVQGTTSEDIKWNANYINLPIMVKFYVSEDFSIDFGPQVGYCVFFNVDGEKFDSEFYNAFDVSLGLGATYNFDKLFISARYNLGLIDVMKDAMSLYNSNIEVGVGYKF